MEKRLFTIFLTYNDESKVNFDVVLNGPDHEVIATVQMITRGTLVASSARMAVAYNEEGYDICAYQR